VNLLPDFIGGDVRRPQAGYAAAFINAVRKTIQTHYTTTTAPIKVQVERIKDGEK